MSEAREQKMREWSSNIFSKCSKDEAPLFQSKRKSESPASHAAPLVFQRDGSSNSRESFTKKKDEGNLFMYGRSLTPSF
jgi:hypothetical protein